MTERQFKLAILVLVVTVASSIAIVAQIGPGKLSQLGLTFAAADFAVTETATTASIALKPEVRLKVIRLQPQWISGSDQGAPWLVPTKPLLIFRNGDLKIEGVHYSYNATSKAIFFMAGQGASAGDAVMMVYY